jgi:hypothetical protein
MKKPPEALLAMKPETDFSATPPLPQSGGSWVREKDGTLRLEHVTDSTPEAIAAAREAVVEAPVQSPVNDPVKEA